MDHHLRRSLLACGHAVRRSPPRVRETARYWGDALLEPLDFSSATNLSRYASRSPVCPAHLLSSSRHFSINAIVVGVGFDFYRRGLGRRRHIDHLCGLLGLVVRNPVIDDAHQPRVWIIAGVWDVAPKIAGRNRR